MLGYQLSGANPKFQKNFFIPESGKGVLACAHGWEKSACTHADLGQAFALRLGAVSAMSVHG